MTCTHPYAKKLSLGMLVCLTCGQPVPKKDLTGPEDALQMPPEIILINERYWKLINPWPLIPFKIAKKYGWYVTMMGADEYLVMPVYDEKGEPVFFSARRLTNKGGPKYRTHKGRRKRLWTSGSLNKGVVLIAEGIADAAYLSQLAPSVALLGSYGNLDTIVKPNRTFVVIMDGDVKGVEAAFRVVQELRKQGHVLSNTASLPYGTDPTDHSLSALRILIRAQTGVKI